MTPHRAWAPHLLFCVVAFPFLVGSGLWAGAHDWPQWRGPHRTGVSSETGLLKDWPTQGPPLTWKATGLGEGYATVSVASGRIFTLGERPAPQKAGPADTFVIALDEKTGKELW